MHVESRFEKWKPLAMLKISYSFVYCFNKSALGLKRTPHLSSEQITQIGRVGFLSFVVEGVLNSLIVPESE